MRSLAAVSSLLMWPLSVTISPVSIVARSPGGNTGDHRPIDLPRHTNAVLDPQAGKQATLPHCMKRFWIMCRFVLLVIALCFASSSLAGEADLTLDRGIAATLSMPEGEGPFPAVLLLHGLGADRHEIGNIYVDSAEILAEKGIASLRFDFRGFGKSSGDTGAFTLDRQNEDALIGLEALMSAKGVDPERIGAVGFSFGGGAAIELAAARPETIKSVVVWSPVGDYVADMLDSLGQKAFDRAAEEGVVGLDLGWRTMALKRDFFDSLFAHDLLEALAAYPGPFMMINGEDDFYRQYATPMMEAAAGTDKKALVIEGADHIYHVYTPSRSKAGQVIEATVERFRETL
ncbi:alpha/beta hydrolase [Paracoccus onubensis]|uniref:alpha/beta hydrolase family protein n=1 Tax=Paracoccus onubensis TaxID=1675788 RepID=UPI002731297D|nr:alpha/beta hydrolase [Paracoccus onubensis]MDP0927981.1 alpha/beta hydrolase [Paracoccus onubensis]